MGIIHSRRETEEEEDDDTFISSKIFITSHSLICRALKRLKQKLRSICKYLSSPLTKLISDSDDDEPILPIQNPSPKINIRNNNDDPSLLVQPLLISGYSTQQKSGQPTSSTPFSDLLSKQKTNVGGRIQNPALLSVSACESSKPIKVTCPKNVPPSEDAGKEDRKKAMMMIQSNANAGSSIRQARSCRDDFIIDVVSTCHNEPIISVPDFTRKTSTTSVYPQKQNVVMIKSKNNNNNNNIVDEGRVIRWIKHYSNKHKILLVGEGDFSFSACLAIAFVSASNMIATSLNNKAFLKTNYQNAPSNLMELRSRDCKIMHGIDVTKMANYELLRHVKFDRIVFNFPFAGFFKNLSREDQLRRHRKLVSLFMKNAREMISEDGEIHITHKTNGFHVEWKLESIASSHGLRLIEAVNFNRMDYPGYNTKCGFGGDSNFDCNPSKTYKFGLKAVRKPRVVACL